MQPSELIREHRHNMVCACFRVSIFTMPKAKTGSRTRLRTIIGCTRGSAKCTQPLMSISMQLSALRLCKSMPMNSVSSSQHSIRVLYLMNVSRP